MTNLKQLLEEHTIEELTYNIDLNYQWLIATNKHLKKKFNYYTPKELELIKRKRESAKRSYQRNKAKRKIADAKRRYREKRILHKFTKEEWEKKVKLTHGICQSCGLPYDKGYGLSLDHEPPLSLVPFGFVYTIDNVFPMCKSCNSSKGNKQRKLMWFLILIFLGYSTIN